MIKMPAQPESAAAAGTARRGWRTKMFRAVAWLLEIALFSLSLAALLPAPSSRKGRVWEAPSTTSTVVATVMFFLSLLIATGLRRESIPGLIVKTLVFGLFAFVAATMANEMATSINQHFAESRAK